MIRGYLRAGSILGERWILCSIRRGFCNSEESPELPDWFKSGGSHSDPPEEDFALPSEFEINGSSQTSKISDVDVVTSVLRGSFSSPRAVAEALDDCAVDVSKDLVDKMLRRFSNDWISAFGFFNWADGRVGRTHSPDSYDAMIDILGKARQFDAMWSLVDEMVQIGQLVTLTTMSRIMRRLAGARRWAEAVEVFHGIERFGVRKDTAAMNIILDTLCKEHAVGRAQDLYLEARDEIPPDASSFNSLIHGWCKVRRFDEARRTMEEMRRFGFEPCVISYTSFIEAYCLDRNFHEVNSMLNEMEAIGCHPNVITYTIIMHSYGKAMETREAARVYEKMKSNGCVPDAMFYNSLIYILTRASQLQDAYVVFEEMKMNRIRPNIDTYNTMIAAACRRSDEEGALRLLQDMEEDSCVPDAKTLAPLLKMKCAAKETGALRRLLDYMVRKDVSLDLGTYSLLVNRLCRSGCLVQACFYFREMVMKGFLPRNSTYVMLVEELERRKLEEGMEKIRNLMARAHRMGGGSHGVPCKFRNGSG